MQHQDSEKEPQTRMMRILAVSRTCFFSTFPKVEKLDTILYFTTDSTCVPENPEMVPRELRLALGNLS